MVPASNRRILAAYELLRGLPKMMDHFGVLVEGLIKAMVCRVLIVAMRVEVVY